MTSGTEQPATRELQGPGDGASMSAGRVLGSSMQQLDSVIARFGEIAHAEASVGPAQTAGGHTVIPLATVSLQAGFGLGFGGGDNPGQGQGSGGGGGGAGRGSSRVIALVDVSDEDVKIRPVPDVTAITLGVIALVGLSVIALRGRPGAGLLRFLRQV